MASDNDIGCGPDWDTVAHDYAAGALTVDEICALHSVDRRTLYDRARRAGWELRSPAIAAATRKAIGARKRKTDLSQRLLTLLERKMSEFETRIADGPASAADSERDARTLNTLVRLFEKLQGFGSTNATGGRTSRGAVALTATNAAPCAKDTHDADRLRNELARRLDKLRGDIGG